MGDILLPQKLHFLNKALGPYTWAEATKRNKQIKCDGRKIHRVINENKGEYFIGQIKQEGKREMKRETKYSADFQTADTLVVDKEKLRG